MRSVMVGGLGVLGVISAVVVGWFMLNESSLVFPGQSRTDLPIAPGAAAEFPWDSLRVGGAGGATTFLIESSLPTDVSGRWAIFFHGNDMLVSDSGGRYALLRAAGFNILSVEFRGYGASKTLGAAEEQGTYLDAMTGWTYLTETRGVRPDSIVVYGFSIGSGPATFLAAQEDLAGIITEGAFTSAPDIAVLRYPWLPVRWLMKTQFSNIERADSVSEPWLLFHGLDDQIVPFSHAGALAKAAPNARVVPLEAGHSNGVTKHRETLLNALREFAIEVFGEAGR